MRTAVIVNKNFDNGDKILFVKVYDENDEFLMSYTDMKYKKSTDKIYDYSVKYQIDDEIFYKNAYVSSKSVKEDVLKHIHFMQKMLSEREK